VRVPLQGRPAPPRAVGPRLRAGLASRHLLPGRDAGRLHRRHPGGRPRLPGRAVGSDQPVLAVHRRGPGGGVRAAGSHSAHHEDRGPPASPHVRAGAAADAGAAGGDRRAQPVDAAGAAAYRAASVQPAQHVSVPAGAAAGGGRRHRPWPSRPSRGRDRPRRRRYGRPRPG
ncbi:hypothetical protein OY671_010869, partial [Metschnikowia pulcherrima]